MAFFDKGRCLHNGDTVLKGSTLSVRVNWNPFGWIVWFLIQFIINIVPWKNMLTRSS